MATLKVFSRPGSKEAASPPSPDAAASDNEITRDSEQWALWMLLAQDGDRAAYHTLLKTITPYLRAITRRYLGRGEDAEDAVQDVLMIVHGIRHTYERGRPFKPWLNTLASRRCIDLLRRRAHRMQHELVGDNSPDDTPNDACGPDDNAAREYQATGLRQAVAALPDRQREAIRLLRLNELSLSEAAAESDQSIGSLKVACHRAIRSLQLALAGKGSTHD